MENFIWRNRARAVAYLELVMSVLSSMAILLRILVAANVTAIVVLGMDEKEFETNKAFQRIRKAGLWWTWIQVAWRVLTTGLKLWASLKLLSATKFRWNRNGNVFLALEDTCIWLNVEFGFACIEVVNVAVDIYTPGFARVYCDPQIYFEVMAGLSVNFWCLALLSIVSKYMKELGAAFVSVRVRGAEAG